MPKAYIIARRAISYRRYITRSARNGYHCKKPKAAALLDDCFLSWRRRRDLKLLCNPSCGARKNSRAHPRFSSIFSTAAPTPARFIAFGALAGVAHAGTGALVQIPFFLIKNQKQPPCWTTAFCLGAEGGI